MAKPKSHSAKGGSKPPTSIVKTKTVSRRTGVLADGKGRRSERGRKTPAARARRIWATARTRQAIQKALLSQIPVRPPAYGLGTCLFVVEATGTSWDAVCALTGWFADGRRSPRSADEEIELAARAFANKANIRRLGRLLAALGNPHRVKILAALLAGPQTYRGLVRATKLRAGPLYHHINQLRLAGFLAPKVRDTYVLTRAGRNLVLVALSLGPLMRDGRIRPVPSTPEPTKRANSRT